VRQIIANSLMLALLLLLLLPAEMLSSQFSHACCKRKTATHHCMSSDSEEASAGLREIHFAGTSAKCPMGCCCTLAHTITGIPRPQNTSCQFQVATFSSAGNVMQVLRQIAAGTKDRSPPYLD
jgi:hypothetical protein